MKICKILFLLIVMIFFNLINIISFSGFDYKNIIFIFICLTLWIISTPDLIGTSKTKQVLTVIFILLLLIIGYFSINWKYLYPLQMWSETSWLYIPIILFITSKIINSDYFLKQIANNKKLIITYIITFIIVLGIITLIEKITENAQVDIIHSYLGIVSSALFIYQLYKCLNIKIDINVINLLIILIELLSIILLNVSQYQKISKYTNSAKNISSIINSENLTYNDFNNELNNQIVEYHSTIDDYDNYYNHRNITFLSISREWDYGILMSLYKKNITKNNFKTILNNYKENMYTLDTYISINKMYSSLIIINMLLPITETILFICLTNKKKHLV